MAFFWFLLVTDINLIPRCDLVGYLIIYCKVDVVFQENHVIQEKIPEQNNEFPILSVKPHQII